MAYELLLLLAAQTTTTADPITTTSTAVGTTTSLATGTTSTSCLYKECDINDVNSCCDGHSCRFGGICNECLTCLANGATCGGDYDPPCCDGLYCPSEGSTRSCVIKTCLFKGDRCNGPSDTRCCSGLECKDVAPEDCPSGEYECL